MNRHFQTWLALLLALSFYGVGLSQEITLDSLINRYQEVRNPRDTFGWTDRSEEAYEILSTEIDQIWDQFSQLSVDQSDIQDMISYDLFQIVLTDQKFGLDWGERYLLLNSEGGFLTEIIYTFGNLAIRSNDDFDSYLNRLRGIPGFLQNGQRLLEKGSHHGKVRPKVIVERCIALMDFHLEKQEESSLFFEPISEGSPVQKERALEIIRDRVLPAYRDFKTFLETKYLPIAPAVPGISSMTDGEAFYRHKVGYFTTLDMTPEEVFRKGKSEVERIRREMDKIIERLDFEGSFEEFLTFLRTDEQFYASTPQQLLHFAAWISKNIEAKLPQYFNTLPRNPFTVRPVPEALAPNYTGGRYSPGSYHGRRAGAYWVNTHNLPSRPLYVLPALTLHEAVPGHHLQGSLAQEISLSSFRRGTYLSAFGEGWALYGEYLGKEMGIYETPYEDFGRLTYEMWRACRLVVDVGIHFYGWSREQAVEYMAGNTALSFHEVNNEIDRYIGWPGQAISYKIGELTIKDLRKRCEEKYGVDFHLPTFHDNILKNGSMPLSTLSEIAMNRQSHVEERK